MVLNFSIKTKYKLQTFFQAAKNKMSTFTWNSVPPFVILWTTRLSRGFRAVCKNSKAFCPRKKSLSQKTMGLIWPFSFLIFSKCGSGSQPYFPHKTLKCGYKIASQKCIFFRSQGYKSIRTKRLVSPCIAVFRQGLTLSLICEFSFLCGQDLSIMNHGFDT